MRLKLRLAKKRTFNGRLVSALIALFDKSGRGIQERETMVGSLDLIKKFTILRNK